MFFSCGFHTWENSCFILHYSAYVETLETRKEKNHTYVCVMLVLICNSESCENHSTMDSTKVNQYRFYIIQKLVFVIQFLKRLLVTDTDCRLKWFLFFKCQVQVFHPLSKIKILRVSNFHLIEHIGSQQLIVIIAHNLSTTLSRM